ncbi:MAG: hypothetical protein KFW07_03005 [Mycoplasmataceae bacterium]|nr:hypothetical protein [Mycoplasmataceae bacterium]
MSSDFIKEKIWFERKKYCINLENNNSLKQANDKFTQIVKNNYKKTLLRGC